jgi:anti-sigma28 factor (negative regulator of flagellin synthesis)
MPDEPKAPIAIDLTALGHRLLEQAEGSPEREALLERLRKQIQSGEYYVDSETLARKLMEEAEREAQSDHLTDEAK